MVMNRALSGGLWLGISRFFGFCDGCVPYPSLIFQFDMLNGNGIRIGVQVRQCQEFGYPAPEDIVSEGQLSCLVVDLVEDRLHELVQSYFGTQARAQILNLLG